MKRGPGGDIKAPKRTDGVNLPVESSTQGMSAPTSYMQPMGANLSQPQIHESYSTPSNFQPMGTNFAMPHNIQAGIPQTLPQPHMGSMGGMGGMYGHAPQQGIMSKPQRLPATDSIMPPGMPPGMSSGMSSGIPPGIPPNMGHSISAPGVNPGNQQQHPGVPSDGHFNGGQHPGFFFLQQQQNGAVPAPDDDPTGSRRSRGNYKCSKCGLPKKGHICAYQPRLRRRDGELPPESYNAAVQVEMDPEMTVRQLKLHLQGTPESYSDKYTHGANVQSVDMNGVSTGIVPHLAPMIGMPAGAPEMHSMGGVPFPMQHQNFQRHDMASAGMPMPMQHMARPPQSRQPPQMGGTGQMGGPVGGIVGGPVGGPVPLVTMQKIAGGQMHETLPTSMSVTTTQPTTSTMPPNMMTQMNRQEKSPTVGTFNGTTSLETSSMDSGVITSTSLTSTESSESVQVSVMPSVSASMTEKEGVGISDNSMATVNSVLNAVQPITSNTGDSEGAETSLPGTHEI